MVRLSRGVGVIICGKPAPTEDGFSRRKKSRGGRRGGRYEAHSSEPMFETGILEVLQDSYGFIKCVNRKVCILKTEIQETRFRSYPTGCVYSTGMYLHFQPLPLQQRLFFHFSQLDADPNTVQLGDGVEFYVATDTRTGKLVACEVVVLPPGSVQITQQPVSPLRERNLERGMVGQVLAETSVPICARG